MNREITKSILVDNSTINDKSLDEDHKKYASSFTHHLIEELISAEKYSWEIFLTGFGELSQNLIDLGFSKFAIEEIKDKITFIPTGDNEKVLKNKNEYWINLDNVIYEIEPDVFLSFNFLNGLPSNKKLRHTYEDTLTSVYVHNYDTSLLNKNGFLKIRNYKKVKTYKKMFEGVKSADIVITPNNFVAEDLIAQDNALKDKIKIYYPGIDTQFTTDKESKSEEEISTILNVYGVESEKYIFFDYSFRNTEEIDRATSIIKKLFGASKRPAGLEKVLFLGMHWYKKQGDNIEPRTKLGKYFIDKCEETGILNYISTAGNVDSDEVVVLLEEALAYLSINDYSGFTFGPIQALALGTPVFIDNGGIVEQNMLKFVHVLDSSMPRNFVGSMSSVLEDLESQKERIKKGKKSIKKYTWSGALQRYVRELTELV